MGKLWPVFIAGLFVIGCGGTAIEELDAKDVGGGGKDTIHVTDDDSPDSAGREDVAGDDVSPDLPDLDEEPVCVVGEACDDHDPCTIDDKCNEDLICEGTLVAGCDDGLDCTIDSCVAEDDCTHELAPGWCLIEGECFQDGDLDPENPCKICITAIATDQFLVDDTLTCDDGNACTLNDKCMDGICVGQPMDCDDGDECSVDSCEDGVCKHVPVDDGLACNDNSFCTINDKCVAGKCVGEVVECDDNNICTDDSCDPEFGCVYQFNNAPCDDGNPCSVGDTCQQGECVAGSDELNCDDGNPCTDDYCSPVEGCLYINHTRDCDDGDPCTVGDACNKGQCEPGTEALNCDDGNVCHSGTCVPFVGCQYEFVDGPCDDGEFCTVGDYCHEGVCMPGLEHADCDDGNPCTDDFCTPGVGCEYNFNSDPCDDGNACTAQDTCILGVCTGVDQSAMCDDGLECTEDSCDPDSGCVNTAINDPECRPQVVVTYPPRGVTLDGDRDINVTGYIQYTRDADKRMPRIMTINNSPVIPMPPTPGSDPIWNFTFPMHSKQGMNPIVIDVNDSLGLKDHVVQTYYYSTQYYPVDIDNPESSMVPDGLALYLGQPVWDDGDRSTPDDIATILQMYLANMDLASMIPSPAARESFLGCTYNIYIEDITYGAPQVSLSLIDGGLSMHVVIPNFRAKIRATSSAWHCPNIKGTVTASSITIDSQLAITLDAVTGEPRVVPISTNVTVHNLNIDLDGVLGALTNWLINFFEDTFARKIEEAFEEKIEEIIPKLEEALAGLALSEDFDIPPFFDGMSPVTLGLRTKISRLDFSPAGAIVGMAATVVTPKGTTHNPLGSIGRASCLAGLPEALPAFPVGSPEPSIPSLELGLMDDLLNLIPYGLYWSGATTMPVPPELIGDKVSDYGITDMVLNVDLLLPPIVTACNEDEALSIEVGDIEIQADMKLFGTPVQMTMYASIAADVDIVAIDGEAGKEISLAIQEPRFIDVEIASLSGGLATAEDLLGGLVRDMLIPQLLESLTGDSLGSFPIPEFDLSGLIEGLPGDASISILIREVLRSGAYTVVSGDVG